MEHWNESDPVADTQFPNITRYEPHSQLHNQHEFSPCPTATMEEVNPNG